MKQSAENIISLSAASTQPPVCTQSVRHPSVSDGASGRQGWRWSYFISGGPGIALGILMIFTLKEPQRAGVTDESRAAARQKTFVQRLPEMLRLFFRPSLFLLCFAGAIRNAGERGERGDASGACYR